MQHIFASGIRQARDRATRGVVCTSTCSCRRAFTLLEVVLVAGVLMVLLSIAIPALGAARGNARATRCLAHARSAQLLVLAYASDARDAFPSVGPIVARRELPSGGSMRLGGLRGLANGAWTALFPDEWQGPLWRRDLRCPRDPIAYALPKFWMSRALWIAPVSMGAGRPYSLAMPFDARVTDVLHPSKKSVLFEQAAYCSLPGAFEPRLMDTPGALSSLTLVDGSARRMRREDGVRTEWTPPFDATIDGVRGRDVE